MLNDPPLSADLDRDLLPPAEVPSRPQGIDKVRYSHEAMADMIIAQPWISQNELAKRFGYTASWVSQIICSDAFQALLAKRRDILVTPEVAASIKDQFQGLVGRCAAVLRTHLNRPDMDIPPSLAVSVLKISKEALGLGARPEPPRVEVNVTARIEDLAGNLEVLLDRRRGLVIDATPENPK